MENMFKLQVSGSVFEVNYFEVANVTQMCFRLQVEFLMAQWSGILVINFEICIYVMKEKVKSVINFI